MTGIDLQSTAPAAHDLRVEVRQALEEEYVRLRTVDRPASRSIIEQGEHDEGFDPVVADEQLALVDRRIEALHAYLGTVRLPQQTDHPVVDYCVHVDLGEGPRWMLLTELAVLDERVITADSALGRAIVAAAVGDTFEYRTQSGAHRGVLRGVETGSSDAIEVALGIETAQIPAPRRLLELESGRALELLRNRKPAVGRLGFNLFGIPHIEVVNFLVDGDDLIFRINPGSKLTAVNYGGHFALQVDDLDTVKHTGWTVTVTGPVQRVRGPEAERLFNSLVPWAAGERPYIVRLKPRRVVGRALEIND
jgi:transcription elongation GreA/GreB family factor